MLPANFSLVAEEAFSRYPCAVAERAQQRALWRRPVSGRLWQCWLLREPEGTGLLTDTLQFNPTCFNHKGTVGLTAT